MLELLEFALDTCVAPGRVLRRHAHDEFADLLLDAGATCALAAVRPFLRDKLAVPAKDGVDLCERLAPEDLALGCQSAALVVGEAKALAAELFLHDSILLDQVLDRVSGYYALLCGSGQAIILPINTNPYRTKPSRSSPKPLFVDPLNEGLNPRHHEGARPLSIV